MYRFLVILHAGSQFPRHTSDDPPASDAMDCRNPLRMTGRQGGPMLVVEPGRLSGCFAIDEAIVGPGGHQRGTHVPMSSRRTGCETRYSRYQDSPLLRHTATRTPQCPPISTHTFGDYTIRR